MNQVRGMGIVSVIINQDPHKAVVSALGALNDWAAGIKDHPRILVKPNFCGGVVGEPGSYTSLEVLEEVLKILSSFEIPLCIGEADCSFNDANRMFKELRVYELAKRYGCRVENLSRGPARDIPVPNPSNITMLRVAEILLNAFIISVPVLKTHPWSGVTISMKNMYGAIYQREKFIYHSGLDDNIVDINKVIKPHLNIVDGTIAVVSGGFKYGLWVGTPPTRLDCVIAGHDPVAVDTIGTRILGRKLEHIPHITKAAQQKLGTCRIEEINLVGNGVSLFA